MWETLDNKYGKIRDNKATEDGSSNSGSLSKEDFTG